MSDVVLNGTSDSIDDMDVFIPRFQIRVNKQNQNIDTVRACRTNRFEEVDFENDNEDSMCSNVAELNLVKIVNNIMEWYAVDDLLQD